MYHVYVVDSLASDDQGWNMFEIIQKLVPRDKQKHELKFKGIN